MRTLAKTATAALVLAAALTLPAQAATTESVPHGGYNIKCLIFPRLCH